MKGNFRDLQQVEVLKSNGVALFVLNFQIPQSGLFFAAEGNVETVSVLERILAEYVLFPIVGTMGSDKQLVNGDTGLIVDGEILITGVRCRRRPTRS